MSLEKESVQNGKLIVFEGGDGSGKHTQTKLLFEKLQSKIKDIELLSFPQYNTPFGSLVAKYLRGEYGSLNELPPEVPCLLYALDRYQFKSKLETELAAGKWFIADRYTQSNFGHQGAKLPGAERDRLITWIEQVESRLPQPDLVVYLHVPVIIAQQLMNTREHKEYLADDIHQDIHELDEDYQKRVAETYLKLSNTHKNWVKIQCVNKSNNELRSKDEIHKEIISIVNERFEL